MPPPPPPSPPPPPPHLRINLAEMKSRIGRKLGPERAKRYFTALNKLLSRKLTKSEFNKFCLSVLGRDFIPLHNLLLRSILQNAHNAAVPPPTPKSRSGVRQSPLGPNVRAENGFLSPFDSKRMVENGPAEQPVKRQRVGDVLPHVSIYSDVGEPARAEDGEELVDKNVLNSSRQPILAPLGIPFFGGAWGSSALASTSIGSFSGNYDGGELCDTVGLRNRMERIAETQGLGGVTMDSANVLNHGVDAYLKRLISSCVELVGARSGREEIKQQPQMSRVNGVLHENHTRTCQISLQDFKVAMQLNPQQLGEHWPLLLEKLCIRTFEN